jgi:hypothetical protein
MYINNNELCELKLLYNAITTDEGIITQSNVDTLAKILERAEVQKAKKDSYNARYMREKRKEDKTYGQSYERKNKILGL